jgi:PAS domain S-box-containing protein
MNLLKKNSTKSVAVFTIIVGGMALVGWFFDITALKTILPSSITMKFNTALCFFLLGVSLFFHTNDKFKIAINICFAIVSLIGLLTLIEYLFGLDLKIDELFWRDVKNPVATSSPGRMSPNTAFGFFMLGTALLFIRNKKLQLYVVICLTLGLLGALTGVFSFMVGYGLHDVIPSFSQIALITAFTLFVLCIGVIYSPYLSQFKFSFEQRLSISFGFTILILFGLFYVYGKNRDDFVKTKELINHTRELISWTESILTEVTEVETGARGYVITGDSIFLEPYTSSVFVISGYLSILKKTSKNDNLQKLRVDSLEKFIVQKVALTKQMIALRKNKGFEDAKKLVVVARGKILMDSIRIMTGAIQKAEITRLENQKLSNVVYEKNSNRVIVFFQIVSVLVLMSLFVIIVKNLKRRKQIEILLRKSNERFFKIFNHSPVSMAITSTSDGVFLYVNDAFCQLTGYERENIIGRKSVDVNIISHDGRAKSVENIKKNGGKVKDVELKINRVNGEVIDILFSADTLEIDNEMCFVYASIDISERKKAEEKLREANKELDSFSYSVSHDLRTPLRAISGYTKILIEDYSDKMDSEGRRIMDVIVNNARKMGQLIDDLLAFSRLGKQNLVKVDIDMSFLVHSIADVFMDQSLNKEIEIDIKKLDSVMGDSSMIKIVVDNLLANALKYSSKKEKIKIEVGSYQEGKTTVYYIKDNGVGFDMLYYDKLFGVFQRLHSTSEFEGTGVGLAIVQRIVGRHGGKVWAVAKVDEGATFYFSLPIV